MGIFSTPVKEATFSDRVTGDVTPISQVNDPAPANFGNNVMGETTIVDSSGSLASHMPSLGDCLTYNADGDCFSSSTGGWDPH